MKSTRVILGKIRKGGRNRGSVILEFVLLALGIAIFCAFGILQFGKAAQHQMNEATQILAGVQEANIFNAATKPAEQSATDNETRAGLTFGRQ